MAWTHYQELIVWQKAMDLADEVYALARQLPREETFALADQLRRAAVSVPSILPKGTADRHNGNSNSFFRLQRARFLR